MFQKIHWVHHIIVNHTFTDMQDMSKVWSMYSPFSLRSWPVPHEYSWGQQFSSKLEWCLDMWLTSKNLMYVVKWLLALYAWMKWSVVSIDIILYWLHKFTKSLIILQGTTPNSYGLSRVSVVLLLPRLLRLVGHGNACNNSMHGIWYLRSLLALRSIQFFLPPPSYISWP